MKSKNKSYKKEDVMRFWPPCICTSKGASEPAPAQSIVTRGVAGYLLQGFIDTSKGLSDKGRPFYVRR